MRNMSFSLTTDQMRRRLKTVTRRLGWDGLKPGDRVCAVVKGQGIPKGGKVERICVIEIVGVSKQYLNNLTLQECAREGFSGMTPVEFVGMFCRANKGCTPNTLVNRIEFNYVEEAGHGG